MNGGLARSALVLLTLESAGCAVIMNGMTSTVEVPAREGARVYVDGYQADAGEVTATNFQEHVIFVRAPGARDGSARLTPEVAAGPIVLDVVFAVPSLLILPLVDLVFGMWKDLDDLEAPIETLALFEAPRERPRYAVGTRVLGYEPSAPPAPPPPPPEPPVAPPAASTPPAPARR